MDTRIAQANYLIAEYFLTEMDESGLSAEEQVKGLVRELRISRDEAVALRAAWAGNGRTGFRTPSDRRYAQA